MPVTAVAPRSKGIRSARVWPSVVLTTSRAESAMGNLLWRPDHRSHSSCSICSSDFALVSGIFHHM